MEQAAESREMAQEIIPMAVDPVTEETGQTFL